MADKGLIQQRLNAAARYVRRKSISPAHGSSLRKLLRSARIAAGLRPARMPRRKVEQFPVNENFDFRITYDLHPTKGARNVTRQFVPVLLAA